MYYQSAARTDATRVTLPSALPMTPSVALRRLWEQLDSYRKLTNNGARIDLFRHFSGPITPPSPTNRVSIGDPVAEAVAEYTATVLARAGHLTQQRGQNEEERLQSYGRLTRQLFTAEHALAIDLGKVSPTVSLRARETGARATFALAAYWYDRGVLQGIESRSTHPLLGNRPTDAVGKTLFDFAEAALRPPKEPRGGGALGQDTGLGRYISPSAA
jgi:hypothetical protein